MLRIRAILAAVAIAALAGPVAARADDASTLTVVGTSDVFDSDLVQSVLKPGFEAAHPRYTLNYVSKGTGAAIDFAEAGTASALLVHAAPLETRFVADGYSAERYGRAIFWGDYVILGPRSDPAHVLDGATHDAVTAFERIAAAGAAGHANFVSRGGTPGTTIQEHAIWALTKGLRTCRVADADGGGRAPSTTPGACRSDPAAPAWYHTTGLTQAPNIENADTCNYPGGACYVLTDRGTFAYLAATGALADLQIVVRGNRAAARGGRTLLVNAFHAYAVDPARFRGHKNVRLNLPAATAFLGWLTSPPAQAAIGAFLGAHGDPPFIPDAAPALTLEPLPAAARAGTTLTLRGRLRNVLPGAPALVGVPITLMGGGDRPVAETQTGAGGRFALRHRFRGGERYAVSSGRIAQVEDAALRPAYGDLLGPAVRTIVPGGPASAPYFAPAAGTSRTPVLAAADAGSRHAVRWTLGGVAGLGLLLAGAVALRRRREDAEP